MKTHTTPKLLEPHEAFELLSDENKMAVIRQIEILIEKQSESRSSGDSQE